MARAVLCSERMCGAMDECKVLLDQIRHDVENKTRAQLLDLLELALPSDKFALVKRNVDTIMRNMLSRANEYMVGVTTGDGKHLQHWCGNNSEKDSAYICGCGTRFEFKPHTHEEDAEWWRTGTMPEDMARASAELRVHLDEHK